MADRPVPFRFLAVDVAETAHKTDRTSDPQTASTPALRQSPSDEAESATEASESVHNDGVNMADQLKELLGLLAVLDATVDAVYNIDPETHATKSRDFGRGFTEALRVVRDEIDARMGAWGDEHRGRR